jgi:hypothetical protein
MEPTSTCPFHPKQYNRRRMACRMERRRCNHPSRSTLPLRLRSVPLPWPRCLSSTLLPKLRLRPTSLFRRWHRRPSRLLLWALRRPLDRLKSPPQLRLRAVASAVALPLLPRRRHRRQPQPLRRSGASRHRRLQEQWFRLVTSLRRCSPDRHPVGRLLPTALRRRPQAGHLRLGLQRRRLLLNPLHRRLGRGSISRRSSSDWTPSVRGQTSQ